MLASMTQWAEVAGSHVTLLLETLWGSQLLKITGVTGLNEHFFGLGVIHFSWRAVTQNVEDADKYIPERWLCFSENEMDSKHGVPHDLPDPLDYVFGFGRRCVSYRSFTHLRLIYTVHVRASVCLGPAPVHISPWALSTISSLRSYSDTISQCRTAFAFLNTEMK